jgi:putative copper resistance protein D
LGDPLVYVRAVHFAATIVAAGTVLFMFLVSEPAFRGASGDLVALYEKLRRRWLAIVWASLIIAVMSGAAWLILLAANIYGAGIGEVWRDGGLWTVVSQTRFGYVWSVRLVLAALLAAYPMAPMTPTTRSQWGLFAAILATGFLIAPAWIGHAGATPGEAGQIPLAADALHLLAAGAWLGGLPPLAMLLAVAWRHKEPSLAAITRTAVQRFSLLGLASVGALLASGVINSWYEVGSFGNLLATAYGQLIVVKLGLFATMIALAAVNRFYLTPRLAMAGAVQHLQHNTMMEAALGFAAVLIVGFLGAMAPASHMHQHRADAAVPEGAAFVHIHSVAGMADVTIAPGRVGTARINIRLWNEEDDPLIAQSLTFTLTPPNAASKPVVRTAAHVQGGLWQVDGIELGQPGNWTAAVDAELNAGHRLTLEAPIVIEPKE